MREDAYRDWLAAQGKEPSTLATSCSTLRRLETAYGDLDVAFLADGFEAVLAELAYSRIDQRNGEANPSRLAIKGDIYDGLASARTHLNNYRRFREEAENHGAENAEAEPVSPAESDPPEAVLSLERDLNAALRQNLAQLETGLKVIDNGRERSVASGRIDILAEDAQGRMVVIELKAVRAPRDAVAQVLAYMGDIQTDHGVDVRGLLIAPDFDPRALSAARMVPALELKRFAFQFTFGPVDTPGKDGRGKAASE